jgi:hypothetical protein
MFWVIATAYRRKQSSREVLVRLRGAVEHESPKGQNLVETALGIKTHDIRFKDDDTSLRASGG